MKREDMPKANQITKHINQLEGEKSRLEMLPDGKIEARLSPTDKANLSAGIGPEIIDLTFVRDMAIRNCEKEIKRLEKKLEEL